MVWLNLTMLLCILWSSNCCESNTQIGRNPVFLNSLFCTCIPILFLSISYPCIVGILQFKRALTELLLLQIVVKENLAWFVPLLLRRRPPQLSCSNDRRVQHSRDPASRLSFAASDLLPRRWQPWKLHVTSLVLLCTRLDLMWASCFNSNEIWIEEFSKPQKPSKNDQH